MHPIKPNYSVTQLKLIPFVKKKRKKLSQFLNYSQNIYIIQNPNN